MPVFFVCLAGYTIDMLSNTPNYRVAMVSGPQARHIRFAVFALFERFTEKGVRVVMLAQEVACSLLFTFAFMLHPAFVHLNSALK